MTSRVLLTGAAGFVGSHVLRHFIQNTDWEIVCPVTFRHQGRASRIQSALEGTDAHDRVSVLVHDLRTPFLGADLAAVGEIDYIFNVASESHVDRSISEPGDFIRNNVDLMINVLELAMALKPKMVLQMSTDEVYGPAEVGTFHKEWDGIRPSNPYSASKAAQEAIAFSYWRTYNVPVVITNTMNIIGEAQDAEKFLPMVLKKIAAGESVPVHANLSDPDNPVVGSRCWLHARNLADAWLFIARELDVQLYPEHPEPLRLHIVGHELTNLELAQRVAAAAGKKLDYELVDFHSSRPGHDLRYALDGNKIEDLGWKPPVPLEDSIDTTVKWTLDHPQWLS